MLFYSGMVLIFRKKYGQNFLGLIHIVLDKIIGAAQIGRMILCWKLVRESDDDTVSRQKRQGEVVAVEIDTKLIPILQDTLKEYDNVNGIK